MWNFQKLHSLEGVGNTKHARVSCISIQTRKPQVEKRNKHEKKVETRNKHEKLENPRSFKYYKGRFIVAALRQTRVGQRVGRSVGRTRPIWGVITAITPMRRPHAADGVTVAQGCP